MRVRIIGDGVREVRGSDMRTLWSMIGTVDFTLNEIGAVRGF